MIILWQIMRISKWSSDQFSAVFLCNDERRTELAKVLRGGVQCPTAVRERKFSLLISITAMNELAAQRTKLRLHTHQRRPARNLQCREASINLIGIARNYIAIR